MIKVNKKINLSQLDKELNGQGLIAELDQDTNEISGVALGENNTATEIELEAVIKNHKAIDENAELVKAKAALLERLGMTADEAALLLQ
jgi:hypothetical protein